MSFFADEDNITFGVQGSNIAEVAQFSSTLDDVFVRLFTNNNSLTDNFVTGTVIGSSNYDKSASKLNNLYLGHVTGYSNIQRVITIQNDRVGINTTPASVLHVYGDTANSWQDVMRVDLNSPAFVIDRDGQVGINTEPVNGNALTISGAMYVDSITVPTMGAKNFVADSISSVNVNNTIDFNNNFLSNIGVVDVRRITATRTSGVIDSSFSYLSNVQKLDTKYLTNTTYNGVIDVTQSTLSNINVTNTENLIVHNITTNHASSNIDVSGKSLSNITGLYKVNTVDVTKLTTTQTTTQIDVDTKTLSNINIVNTVTIETSNLNTNAPGGYINVSGKSLSNITNVNTITTDTSNLTTRAAGGFINVSGYSLSNIATLSKVNTLDLANLTTTQNNGEINVNNKSLSNVNLSRVHLADIQKITSSYNGGIVDFDQKHLSNLNILNVRTLTSSLNDTIDASQLTLSNIKALAKVTTIDIANIVNTMNDYGSNVINANQTTLSNIDGILTDIVEVETLRGKPGTNVITSTNVTLSNLKQINMDGTNGKIYTNFISTVPDTGSTISFNNKNLSGISNLNVIGDITVRGDFFVMDTVTCNTTQFRVDNDGTGPALIVNQRGDQDIAQFMDDSNIVMYLRDGGQVAVGNFGTSVTDNLPMPESALFVYNPNYITKDNIYVTQENTAKNRITLVGASGATPVFVDGVGKLGIGVTTATARFDVNQASGTNDLIRVAQGGANKLTFTYDGKLGIGVTNPSELIEVNGTVKAPTLRTDQITSDGATIGTNEKTFNTMKSLETSNISMRIRGTAAAPSINFIGDLDTGVFSPDANMVALTTNGTERLRVQQDGNVGIGTTIALTQLQIEGTVRAPTIEINTLSSTESLINVNAKTLSNIDKTNTVTVETTNLIGTGLINKLINVSASVMSNITSVKTVTLETTNITTTAALGYINVNNNSLSNVTNIFNTTLTNTTVDTSLLYMDTLTTRLTSGVINVSNKSLSNIQKLSSSNIAVNSITTVDAEGGFINVNNRSLSNITILSKVGTIDVNKLTTTDTNNIIDVDTKSLSNITNVNTVTIQTSNLNTLAAGGFINVNNHSLSNITYLSKVGTLDIQNIVATQTSGLINASQTTLSNIDIVKTDDLEVTNIKPLIAGAYINVNSNTLSNLTSIYDVVNLDIQNLTTRLTSGVINVSNKSLSNLNTVKTSAIEVSTINTLASGSLINVANNSLSNINILSKVGSLDITKITNTRTSNIDFDAKTLSNIEWVMANNFNVGVLSSEDVSVNSISTNLASGLINVSGKSLSNINLLSHVNVVDTIKLTTTNETSNINVDYKSLSNIDMLSHVRLVDTTILTTTDANNKINVDTKSLSNITDVNAITVQTSNLTTRAAGGFINVNTYSLSNITYLSKVGTIDVTKITSTQTGKIIDVDQNVLSNIDDVKTNSLEVSTITTIDSNNRINVSYKSLSNINYVDTNALKVSKITTSPETSTTIDFTSRSISNVTYMYKVGTIDVTNLTTTATNSTIDVSYKSLSNINRLTTNNFQVTTLQGDASTNIINMTVSELSNVGDIRLAPNKTIYVDYFNGASGCNINFNNVDVENINNLTVNGKITVNGEFFVMETTTCNTNQFQIDNDGTGPALIVNQRGNNTIAQFSDDSNIVMFIEDGGKIAMGSFGTSIVSTPDALLYVDNPTASYDALYVKQSNNSKALMKLVGTSSNVIVTADGRIGMGVNAPTARIQVKNAVDDAHFLKYSSPAVDNAFVVANNGSIGVNEAPINYHAFTTPGSVQLGKIYTNSFSSSNNLTDFNNISLSNIFNLSASNVKVHTIQAMFDSINVSGSSLSNINFARASTAEISTLTSTLSNINVSYKSLSNISTVDAKNIQTNKLTSTNSVIDVDTKSLCNINEVSATTVVTDTLTGRGASKNVSFNYSRVLDVDSLVVRSNIQVTLTGLNNYQNLPADIVRLDAATNKILDSYISSNIVRLMNNGLLNPALLPPIETNRNTLMHTRDKVGIGLRNPQQKLHVHGNQVITSGRLGVGTTTPLYAMHVHDENSGLASFAINNEGSTDIIQVKGKYSTPVLYASSSCNVGVRTSAPSYELHVAGTIYGSTAVRTNALDSDSGLINCRSTSLSNIFKANINDLVVSNTVSLPSTTTSSVYTDTLGVKSDTKITVTSPMNITGYDTGLYSAHSNLYGENVDITRIGLRVTNSILTRTLLTTSDERAKNNIVLSPIEEDLNTVMNISVKRFNFREYPNEQPISGFIAQEVEKYAPYAVKTTVAPIPSILKTVERDENNLSLLLNISDDSLKVGDILKILVDNEEYNPSIVAINENEIVMDKDIPNGNTFVYGPIVNDFKLLESDRLLPITFNAIKGLQQKLVEQQSQIDMILSRLVALEK